MRKNIFLMAAYQIIALVLPLITLPYVSRVLGPEGVGIYAYSNSIVNYFMVFSLLGIQLYGKREIAKVNNNKIERSRVFIEIYCIQFVMSTIMSIIYLIFVFLTHFELRSIFILQFAMMLSVFLDISWLYFGLEKFKITVLRNLGVKLISIILIFSIVKTHDDLGWYVLIMSASTFISQGFLWLNLKKYISFVKVDYKSIIIRFLPITSLFIPVLAIQLFTVIDKTMLGSLSSLAEVGFYENANRITRVPISVITSAGVVMLPRMTHLYETGDYKSASKYIEKSVLLTMFIAIACTSGLIAISDKIVPLVLGREFLASSSIIKILSPILIFIAWGNVFRTQYILPRGLDRLYTKSVVFAAILNVFLNLILIPLYQGVGAAIASLFSEGLICIYQSIIIGKDFMMSRYFRESLKYIISGLLMMFIVTNLSDIFQNQIPNIIYQVLVGVISYFTIALFLERISGKPLVYNELKTLATKIRNKFI
ncbi:flippase [Sedimentibacter sp. B4]|uniref:flippase n=1 Tax=Sedimentibacter sp. B4 TaxID=304766 RepID=UPI0002E274AC|nr:flippase [Sedimentibacter sp. B4]